MIFDDEAKVIVDSMTKEEATAFIKFLDSECIRHQMDIDQARELIKTVVLKFDIR